MDALRQHGAAPKEDMRALWRRIVLSILISNTDDHLRNHGFLYQGAQGWRLAPACRGQVKSSALSQVESSS